MIAALIKLITGVQPRWLGCEPEVRPRVYFANHSSNLDGPVIWAALPPDLRRRTRPVAAADYWGADPLRRFLARRVFRAVLISRRTITRENNPMTQFDAVLAAGDSLIIFPEGTRTLDDAGALGPFKPGLFHLAREHPQVQLVPVYLENLNRILPKGEYLIVPLVAAVTFGAPIELLANENKQDFLERAQRAVAALAEPAEVTA